MPDLSVAVAIITRHRPEVLRECLQRVRGQTVAPSEVVVVDSSEDTLSEAVCREFPEVTYVHFEQGRHQMPTSRNIALMHSSAEVVAYIDDDTYVDSDWLAHLRAAYLQYPEVAGVGGRVTDKRWPYDPQQPIGRVDSGRIISNFFGGTGVVLEVDHLPGCNMSFRRKWLEAVGGVDPGYVCTNHREDPDICWRIRLIGGTLRYQPAAHAVHLNARTARGEMKRWHECYLRYSFSRNDAYFVAKHFGNSPRAVWRILGPDTLALLLWACKNRSAIVMATIPVSLFAKAIGLAVGYAYRLKYNRGWRPNYYQYAARCMKTTGLRISDAPRDFSIAAAIITRHRPEVLRQCLQHVRAQTVAPSEVVVVDSSEDACSEAVCREFPEVTYVHFEQGRHQMPTSRNIALMHSSAEIIAYLDDDCLADPDCLEKLQEAYRLYPEAAGIGGRVTDKRWHYDPQQPIGRVDALGRAISNFFGDPGGQPEVDYLPGGNMSFRREWLEAVGGVDPGFVCTNHREDTDVCWRIRLIGGTLRYQPAAHAVHLNARTALGEMKRWHEFYLRYSFSRNDAYFVAKHFGNSPRAVWRILGPDTLTLLRWACKNRSAIVMATIPVSLFAKAIGLVPGYAYRLKYMRGWRPNYYQDAVRRVNTTSVRPTDAPDHAGVHL